MPASSRQGLLRPAEVPADAPVGGTGAAAGGWDTAGHRDSAITTINGVAATLRDLLRVLRAEGIIE